MSFAEDPFTRAEIERISMEAVMAAERALGHDPRDVSAEKKGWDIESRDARDRASPLHRGQGPPRRRPRRDPHQE